MKINELADIEDLESIMTATKREIAIWKEDLEIMNNTDEINFNKQMPVTESTLIRKLYLKRKKVGIVTINSVSTKNSVIDEKIKEMNENAVKDLEVEVKSCEFCIKTAVERFEYIVKSLEYYMQDNPADAKAKGLMTVIKPCVDSIKDDDVKIAMTQLVRNFFVDKVVGNEKYKYLYVWKDFDELN